MKNILFSKYSIERASRFAIRTSIVRDGESKWVEKTPVTEEANEHINSLAVAYQKLGQLYKNSKLYPCPVCVEDSIAKFQYINGESFQDKLALLLQQQDMPAVIKLCQEYVYLIKDSLELKPFVKTEAFVEVFGDIDFPKKLFAPEFSNIDLIFENLIEDNNGQIAIIDYEWCFAFPVPIDYILYRALIITFLKWNMQEFVNCTLCPVIGIDSTLIPSFLQIDGNLCRYIECGEFSSLAYVLRETQCQQFNFEQLIDLAKEEGCHSQVFYDYGSGFTEDKSKNFYYKYGEICTLVLSLNNGIRSLRIDPSDDYSIVSIKKCLAVTDEGIYDLSFQTNGIKLQDSIIFDTLDPQIWFLNLNTRIYEIRLEFKVVLITSDLAEEYRKKQYDIHIQRQILQNELTETQRVMNETGAQLGEARQKLAETQRVMNETGAQLGEARQKLAETQRVMNETGTQLGEARWELAKTQQVLVEKDEQIQNITAESNKLINSCKDLEIAKQEIINEAFSLRCQLAEREQLLTDIQKSFSWKITRPLYNLKTTIYFAMEKRPFTHKIRKAISILRHDGWSEFVRTLKYHIKKRQEHQDYQPLPASNNKDGYKPYDSEYQENQDFSTYKTDIKMLAFYLPQYHTFPENDEWWGKGFTEWVNVKNGNIRFAGHYQPRVPHNDIGYYCLDDINVIRKQAELAKQHGIYGFCFYYYWFSGKRLMERPVDMLLEHPEIDLPFCLCWANENWTRAWDGQNKNVLIGQEYSEQDDEQFIKDLKKYIDDYRYIKINGKPLIVVYNPGHIPDCHKSFVKWRETAKKIGLGEILIWTCQTANNTAELLNIADCVDAEVEFPPHNMWLDSIAVRDMELGGKSAFIYNYQCLVNNIVEDMKKENKSKLPIHHSCMMAWDNAARRKDAWFTFYAFSLKSLYDWVRSIAERARKDFKPEERFIFINAWNEWGEGTYLEPDVKYGYANINTVSKALMNIPFHNDLRFINQENCAIMENDFEQGNKVRIAVQIHMFYLDTLDEVIENVNKIPYMFDCFVSTDTVEKQRIILETMCIKCRANNVKVEIFLNRGRDVAPFLVQLTPILNNYDYICHIHSKKTATNDHGNEWRKYNFKHLFGSADYLRRVFYILENDKKIGIVMPETYPVLELQAEWGGNQEGVKALLHKMNLDYDLPKEPVFPVGNMFWARTDAVKKLFALDLQQEDFPDEAGQVNGTLAHQIERVWVYVAACAGYGYCKIFNNCLICQKLEQRNRLVVFVHYDQNNIISEDDMATITVFSALCSDLFFVTNSNLLDEEEIKIKSHVTFFMERDNVGFDFGAWRDCLLKLGRKKISDYDEIILLNNSCFAPVFDINEMFQIMESKNLDFWGNTVFPYSSDGSYIGKDCIPEHLQSYFMVFNKQALNSDVFWNFWRNVKDYDNLIDVIANCESQLTSLLAKAGFIYEPYIRETYYMSRFLNNYAIPYEKPTSLLLLKDPFIKKKCYQYMNENEKIKLEWFVNQIKQLY